MKGGGGGEALNVAPLPQHDLQAGFHVDFWRGFDICLVRLRIEILIPKAYTTRANLNPLNFFSDFLQPLPNLERKVSQRGVRVHACQDFTRAVHRSGAACCVLSRVALVGGVVLSSSNFPKVASSSIGAVAYEGDVLQ